MNTSGTAIAEAELSTIIPLSAAMAVISCSHSEKLVRNSSDITNIISYFTRRKPL